MAANKEMKQVEKTQIETRAGNLELWTPLYSSVRILLIVSHAYLVLRVRPLSPFWCHVSGRGELGYCKSVQVFSTKIFLSNSQKFSPAK